MNGNQLVKLVLSFPLKKHYIVSVIQVVTATLQVVLHGESGCGKSELINVCSDVMSSMGHNIHLKHINCNAMRPGELLGYFCDTDQYVDCICTFVFTMLCMYVCVFV